jgi:hypothetical protein
VTHKELIKTSTCETPVIHIGNGVFESIGWSVWYCATCNKEIREYPHGINMENQEDKCQGNPFLSKFKLT